MKFMKTEGEGDIALQQGKLTEKEAEQWEKEYLTKNKETPETKSTKWADDYAAASGSGSKYCRKFIIVY